MKTIHYFILILLCLNIAGFDVRAQGGECEFENAETEVEDLQAEGDQFNYDPDDLVGKTESEYAEEIAAEEGGTEIEITELTTSEDIVLLEEGSAFGEVDFIIAAMIVADIIAENVDRNDWERLIRSECNMNLSSLKYGSESFLQGTGSVCNWEARNLAPVINTVFRYYDNAIDPVMNAMQGSQAGYSPAEDILHLGWQFMKQSPFGGSIEETGKMAKAPFEYYWSNLNDDLKNYIETVWCTAIAGFGHQCKNKVKHVDQPNYFAWEIPYVPSNFTTTMEDLNITPDKFSGMFYIGLDEINEASVRNYLESSGNTDFMDITMEGSDYQSGIEYAFTSYLETMTSSDPDYLSYSTFIDNNISEVQVTTNGTGVYITVHDSASFTYQTLNDYSDPSSGLTGNGTDVTLEIDYNNTANPLSLKLARLAYDQNGYVTGYEMLQDITYSHQTVDNQVLIGIEDLDLTGLSEQLFILVQGKAHAPFPLPYPDENNEIAYDGTEVDFNLMVFAINDLQPFADDESTTQGHALPVLQSITTNEIRINDTDIELPTINTGNIHLGVGINMTGTNRIKRIKLQSVENDEEWVDFILSRNLESGDLTDTYAYAVYYGQDNGYAGENLNVQYVQYKNTDGSLESPYLLNNSYPVSDTAYFLVENVPALSGDIDVLATYADGITTNSMYEFYEEKTLDRGTYRIQSVDYPDSFLRYDPTDSEEHAVLGGQTSWFVESTGFSNTYFIYAGDYVLGSGSDYEVAVKKYKQNDPSIVWAFEFNEDGSMRIRNVENGLYLAGLHDDVWVIQEGQELLGYDWDLDWQEEALDIYELPEIALISNFHDNEARLHGDEVGNLILMEDIFGNPSFDDEFWYPHYMGCGLYGFYNPEFDIMLGYNEDLQQWEGVDVGSEAYTGINVIKDVTGNYYRFINPVTGDYIGWDNTTNELRPTSQIDPFGEWILIDEDQYMVAPDDIEDPVVLGNIIERKFMSGQQFESGPSDAVNYPVYDNDFWIANNNLDSIVLTGIIDVPETAEYSFYLDFHSSNDKIWLNDLHLPLDYPPTLLIEKGYHRIKIKISQPDWVNEGTPLQDRPIALWWNSFDENDNWVPEIIPLSSMGYVQDFIGEVGTTSMEDGVQTINLIGHYEDPIVIANVDTYNGTDPVLTRVDNVTESTFDLWLEEWPSTNNPDHLEEQISYLVVESGCYTINGMGQIYAGKKNKTVDYQTHVTMPCANFSIGNGVVLSQAMSQNSGVPYKVDVSPMQDDQNVGQNFKFQGFQSRLTYSPTFSGAWSAPSEEIGFIALGENTSGNNEIPLYVDRIQPGVDHNWGTIGITGLQSYPINSFRILADFQTRNGAHPGGIRMKNLTAPNQVEVSYQESPYYNSIDGGNHMTEEVGLMVVSGNQVLEGQSLDLIGEKTEQYLRIDEQMEVIGSDNLLTNQEQFTVDIRMRWDSQPDVEGLPIWEKHGDENGHVVGLYSAYNGQLLVRVITDGHYCDYHTNQGAIDYTEWNQITVRYNGAIADPFGRLKVLINGQVAQGTNGNQGYPQYACTGTNPIKLGPVEYENTKYPVEIDEFRVWEKALTNDEVYTYSTREFDNCHPSFYRLEMYWDFDRLFQSEQYGDYDLLMNSSPYGGDYFGLVDPANVGSYSPLWDNSCEFGSIPEISELEPVDDSYVAMDDQNNAKGALAVMKVQKKDNTSNTYRTYLKFDLSSVSSQIQDVINGNKIAKLKIHTTQDTEPDAVGRIYRVTWFDDDSWTEESLTWSNMYTGTYSSNLSSATGVISGTMEWDVSSAFSMESGTDISFRVHTGTGGFAELVLYSKEASDISLHPTLTFESAAAGRLGAITDEESEAKYLLSVYPNPALDYVKVNFNLNDSSPARINIIDLSGRKVLNRKFNLEKGNQTIILDDLMLRGINPGVYVIRIETNEFSSENKLIIE